MADKCHFRKKNGTGCEANAQPANGLCVFHDPARASDGRRARRAGGITRSRAAAVLPSGTPDHPLGNTKEVSAFLADSINQLRRGQLDPRVANGMGYLTNVLLEVNFCAYFVLTGNVKQASLQAGYSAWWGYELLKMTRIQPTLRDFERRKKEEAWETAKGQILLTREFLDELFIQRLVNMKTHPKVGDLPIVKMFETGYKRTGDIQATRISAQATAGVASQLYAKRLYLPDWRKEAIERIQSGERKDRDVELPNKSNARPM